MASHGINFVNENDARRVLLALFKKIAHAARAHAHEHFHEVRTGNREEGNVGFTGDRSRQQCLARSRRSHQEHALGNPSAKLLEFLRIFQELNALFPPDCICRIRNRQKPTRRISGAAFNRINSQSPLCTSFTFSWTALSFSALVTSGASSLGMVTWNFMFGGLLYSPCRS